MAATMAQKYGMISLVPPGGPAGAGITNGSVTTDPSLGRLNPDNPMLWLFGIGAATLGLVAVSTSIRVGPVRASASI